MQGLFSPAMWGSPVGIAIFFVGLAALFWGIGQLAAAPDKEKKE